MLQTLDKPNSKSDCYRWTAWNLGKMSGFATPERTKFPFHAIQKQENGFILDEYEHFNDVRIFPVLSN